MPRIVVNPPAPLLNNAVLRVVVTVQTDNNKQQSLFDYVSAYATVAPSDLSALASAWTAACMASYRACLSPDSKVVQLQVMDLNPGTTPTYNAYLSLVGLAGVHYLPLLTQATIDWGSQLKGQHGRGRTQMPAIPDTFTTPGTDPNVLNATGLTAYGGIGISGLLSLTGGTTVYTPIILTRPIKPPPPTPTPKPSRGATKTGYVVRPLMGTQRRRYIGRGI
jgi:hypothetical protein